MNNTNQAGKGSKPRPINKAQYDKRFDDINWSIKNKTSVTAEVTKRNGKTVYRYN